MCQLWSVANESGMVAQTRGHSASFACESVFVQLLAPCDALHQGRQATGPRLPRLLS